MSKDKMYIYKMLKPILGPIFKFYYNPTIIGKENIPKEGRLLIVGNHKHLYDQCLAIISTKRPIHYMAKKEYFDGKMAWFFKSVGCIPVDRSKKDNNATNSALEVLNNNFVLGLFPEGTRNKTNKKLLPFKFGAVSMANKTDSYILPFGISGDYKFRSENLVVKFGKPYKVSNDLEKENKKLESIVSKLIDEAKNSGK
ncbi:MAG: 1-acyl-sn-glycerol-3-phosphate acyltransferase [Firmicutes bacterium]|nr:1-acyl-sn-glycerol-3-phosphate acyltransferase [Bacillota bacterium]